MTINQTSKDIYSEITPLKYAKKNMQYLATAAYNAKNGLSFYDKRCFSI